MSAPASSWDVAVVGAGAAGLAAASTLSRAGYSVQLLEARDRIGGRIWTRTHPLVPQPLEMGAEFIHGRGPLTFELLQQAQSAAMDTAGSRWTLRGGRLEQRGDVFEDVHRLMQQVAALPAQQDLSVERFLARYADDPSLQEACRYARMMVEGFDAADPHRASVRAIAAEWTGSSVRDDQFRPAGGYGNLLARLCAALDPARTRLLLGTVVHSIAWSSDAVRLGSRSPAGAAAETLARKAIVTVPIGVLQRSVGMGTCAGSDAPAADRAAAAARTAGSAAAAEADASGAEAAACAAARARGPATAVNAAAAGADAALGLIRFEPPLTQKRSALEGLAAGPVVKVVLCFATAFWEQLEGGRYHDAAFFHAPEASFPTFWTLLPQRVPVLTAWAAGPRARKLAHSSAAEIIGTALGCMRDLFGTPADLQPTAAYVHDWQADPFSRGAYSYVTVGGSEASARLAEPLADALFFAGEAANARGGGTVEAALASGVEAAQAVIERLRRRAAASRER